MEGSSSRRQFIQGSLVAGGMTGIAGCSGLDDGGEQDKEPFPSTTGVDITPDGTTLIVSIWFTDTVQDALEDRDWDGTELITFNPDKEDADPVEKDPVVVDEKTGDAYELRIRAKDTVEHNDTLGRRIVTSPTVQLDTDISVTEPATPRTLFTYSSETVSTARHEFEGVSEMYEFVLPESAWGIGSTNQEASPETSVYNQIWVTDYDSKEFPVHKIAESSNAWRAAAVQYDNNPAFLSLVKLAEAKRGLMDELLALLKSPQNASAEAWASTRNLVGEAMYASAGIGAPTDPSATAQDVSVAYATGISKALGATMSGAGAVFGMIQSKDAIDKAGEQYSDDLINAFEGGLMGGRSQDGIEAFEVVETLQDIEEETMLPSLVLSEPKSTSRSTAHRVYDKHLDTQRALLYEALDTLADGVSDGANDSIDAIARHTLYSGVDSTTIDFIDETKGGVKFAGSTATNSNVAALSEGAVTDDTGGSIAGEDRVEPSLMGYNDILDIGEDEYPYEDGVGTLQPVGMVYSELKTETVGHMESKLLGTAKLFVRVLDTFDLLLNVMRVQQTALQKGVQPFQSRMENDEEESTVGDEIGAGDSFDGEWEFNTENTAGVTSRGDPIEMWVENCSTVTADAALGTVNELSVRFAWEVHAEGWWERPTFAIETESGETLWDGSVSTDLADADIFTLQDGGTASGEYENTWTIETDEPIRLRFSLTPSRHCDAPDHGRTTFKIPSVSISS